MKWMIILGLLLLVGCANEQIVSQDAVTDLEGIVVFETSLGDFEVELDAEKAPISSENFLGYVNDGFYDGLVFHRVIKGFMIQGGGFDKDLNEKSTKASIKNEADNGLKNDKYTLAMARTNEVDSATSQFFINTVNNDFLNNNAGNFGYAVFGKVISGQDTVDKIESVKTTVKKMPDVPVDDIMINKAYVK